MKVDAILLAGARNDGKLQEINSCEYEALIPLGQRPMMSYVIDALKSTDQIERLVVVGPKPVGHYLPGDVEFVESGSSIAENIQIGVAHLASERRVLLVTSDIPLLFKDAIEDFLQRCEELDGDVFYPVVSKEANEKRYPGVLRTYFQLKEGIFTGGNVVLISPKVVSQCRSIMNKVVELRKKPIQLVRMLGLIFTLKFFFKRLTICEIEKRVAAILGVKGIIVISPYPEIGIDVDKPSDWQLTESVLGGQRCVEAKGLQQ